MDDRLGWCATEKVLFDRAIASATNHAPPPFHASLLPKPMPIMSSHTLKRKLYASFFFWHLFLIFTSSRSHSRAVDTCSAHDSDSPTGQSKKSKKNLANNKSAAALTMDVGDRAALNRRAERFRREHEIEKQKQNGGGGQASSLRAGQRNAHPFVNLSRSATPIANADDPEANPVSVLLSLFGFCQVPEMMTHHAAVAERA